MQAQGFAADVFRRCGAGAVVSFAQEYNFPANGKCSFEESMMFLAECFTDPTFKGTNDFKPQSATLTAISEAAEIMCSLVNVMAAYAADDGTLSIKGNFSTLAVLNSLKFFREGLYRGRFARKVTDGKTKFTIHAGMCKGFMVNVSTCILNKKTMAITNMDFLKHIIRHIRSMLL